MMTTLFEPTSLGNLTLKNRIVMAPMTRSRANTDGSPSEVMIDYYTQRASAGLIISEGVYPSEAGKGYCRTPGIVSAQHIQQWKRITDSVKSEGGTMVMQVMHCGRVAHPDNKGAGIETVSASDIPAQCELYTEKGMLPATRPRALTFEEIPSVVQEYRQSVVNAFEAGFEGVELHCTSGYLPAQFLSTGTNQRTDCYGGDLLGRIRFVEEVLAAMSSVDGAGRIGIRICPGNPFNDLYDDNPRETFESLLAAIQPMGLAYLHAIKSPDPTIDVVDMAKCFFKGPLIINDGFTDRSAQAMLDSGEAQAVSFGRSYIANPDLVERFKKNEPLANFNPGTLYTEGREGYTDYGLAG
jgi:N-ethylmaleimide reductase